MVEDEAVAAPAPTSAERATRLTASAVAGAAATLAVLAGAAGASPALLPDPGRPSIAQSAGVAPLFRVQGMSPGDRYTACVDVAVRNPGHAARVFLAGQDVRGSLAGALRLSVQAGPADGASCADFAAAPIYDGSVAELGAGSSPAATGWTPAGDATWRFKFTVTAGPDAPYDSSASVGFAWHLSSIATALPLPPTTPAGRSAHPPVTSAAPVPPAPSPLGPSSPSSHQGGSPSRRVPRVQLGDASPSGFAHALHELFTVVGAVLRHPVYPSVLFGVALLFVLLQDTVDRRDPKLALAPVRNDDLHFDARPAEVHR